MAQKLYEESNIQAIANAIRSKNGLTTTYKTSEMAAAITAIEGGGSTPIEPPVQDGKTRIYIHLEDGRTSPMLGICPNGTVTVDWGDGTEPDTLTGTSRGVLKYTPTHNYTAAGDYVISLTINGVAGLVGNDGNSCLLRYSSGVDSRNQVYQTAIRKIEIGNGITNLNGSAFKNCTGLKSITIPDTLSTISFSDFHSCYSLSSVSLPNSITSINIEEFRECYSLLSVSLPNSITRINNDMFRGCYSLQKIEIPDTVTIIGDGVFYYCRCLSNITIPQGVTSIGDYAFFSCQGMKYYDFTALTAIPKLASTRAFSGIPDDCEIRVPAALANEWKAATNWATYANKIVGV